MIRYMIRCDTNLPIHDIDHLFKTLNQEGEIKVEINEWPDITFTSKENFLKIERLLNSLTDKKDGPILSWNTYPPVKRRFRKTVASIKKTLRSILEG